MMPLHVKRNAKQPERSQQGSPQLPVIVLPNNEDALVQIPKATADTIVKIHQVESNAH